MSTPKRLGRGLDALLGTRPRSRAAPVDKAGPAQPMLEIAVSALLPGRYQPRLFVADDSLAELADSIREQGVLQPLVVRPLPASEAGDHSHEIVAGERRWRAAQLANLSSVPVVVRELDDQSALAVALIENLQREDLNPIEQARSLSRLAIEFELTHEQVARAVGCSRSSVSNLLRLLELQVEVRDMLASGAIEMGHARALLSLDAKQQVSMARKVQRSGLSVRQVEHEVRQRAKRARDSESVQAPAVDLQTRWLQQQIARELGQRVAIRGKGEGQFRLDIDFASLDELQGSLAKMQELIGRLSAAAGPRVRDD